MKRIYFLTEKVYTCPETGKTLTRPDGYPSDGATGAFDINSSYWKFHDVARDRGVWDDGTPITPREQSQIARNCLLHEGRPKRAKYIFWATYLWAKMFKEGKYPDRPCYPNLAGETRLVTRKAFKHYMGES